MGLEGDELRPGRPFLEGAAPTRDSDRSSAETEILFRLSEVTSRCARPEELYEPALDAMHALLGAERASVLLFDDGGKMRFRAWRGLSDRYRAVVDGHSPWSADSKDPRPILIGDASRDESMASYRQIFAAEGIAALAFLPLLYQRQLLGKFMLYWNRPREFSRHEEELAVTIAAHIAQALERARIQEAERNARDRLERMQTIIAALSRAQTTADVANAACRIGGETMAAYAGAMWLLQEDGSLSLIGTWGTPKSFIDQFQTLPPDGDAPAHLAIRRGEPVWVETEEDYQRASPEIYASAKAVGRIAGFGALPILGAHRPLGVVTFAHQLPHRYDADQRAFYVSLAQHCAQALERALLFDERLAQRRRIELLQSVTAALSKAASEEEVIATVVDEGTKGVGATQGAIWLRSPDEDALLLAYSRGYPEATAKGLARIPLSVEAPVVRCVREETALWIDSSAHYYLPLSCKGRSLGAIAFSWLSPGRFADDEKRLVEALALQAAQAIERARLYDEAEEGRRLFVSVLDSVDQGITVLDPTGKVILANSAGARLDGFELFDEAGAPFSLAQLPARVAAQGKKSSEIAMRYRVRGQSDERWSVLHAWPMLDEHGKVFQIVNLFRDVTAARRADERRAFLLRAIEQFNASVDYEDTLAAVARQLVPELADWSAVDIVEGDKLHRLAVVHADPNKLQLVEEVQRRYPPDPNAPGSPEDIVRTRRPFHIEKIPPELLRLSARDPEHLALIERLQLNSYLAVPMQIGNRVVGVLTLAMAESGRCYSEEDLRFACDVADRAALAIENARLFRETARALDREHQGRADAEQAARFAEMFTGILGHDLRSPLQAIGISAQMMLRLATDDRQRRSAESIVSTVMRMARMVDQLLDFTRIRAGGGLKLEAAVMDLGETARQIAEETQAATGCSIELACDGETSGHWDADRLVQVFSNLLANAARHGTSGHPISLRIDGRDAERVIIDLENRGKIPEELLPRLFDPFQGGGQKRRKSGGLGLGLYITRAIVEAHRGTIHVSSMNDVTLFRVELPRRPLGDHSPTVR